MTVVISTKAETLERLAARVTTARVLPQIRCTVGQWLSAPEYVVSRLRVDGWLKKPLIVRSSAACEDSAERSCAGRFLSVPNVLGEASVKQAISRVIDSYGPINDNDQILIQPMLEDVALSGVAFSTDPNTGSPYLVINFDTTTSSTSSVTGGSGSDLKTCYWYKDGPKALPEPLNRVATLLDELEVLLNSEKLDVEFALTRAGELYLLQARPLTGVRAGEVPPSALQDTLEHIAQRVAQLSQRHPYLYGERTIFGVMPDWNPAEIIGIRPRPLALSTYKELITDSIWAYQRDNYGYCNLRSFPLLISLGGVPYTDVRVSFNSFLPKDLDDDLSERLVNHYLDRLSEDPTQHDKVEFEIIFTCYTLDLPKRLRILEHHGFNAHDRQRLTESLLTLTNTIIHDETGLWRHDIARIERLEQRLPTILGSSLDTVGKIYWILEDCKRYGTLPFAGLARAGFIAVQMLKSLIAVGVFTQDDYDAFMCSLNTVSSQMSRDFNSLSREVFLQRYGHLRPGTYDILSPRYDEAPERYFDWGMARDQHDTPRTFQLTLQQLKVIEQLLREHGLEHNVLSFFNFIKLAIEGREYAKFVFTRGLSEALTLFGKLGEAHGLSRQDCSFADIRSIAQLYGSSQSPKDILSLSVEQGRLYYAITEHIQLPPLITCPDDVWMFELPPTEPNFVTQNRASGRVSRPTESKEVLRGSVLLIPSADPGYDWIFSHDVAAFVTMYGGINSHMAIRAAELNIPAVIGAGQTLFDKWSKAGFLEVDCANRQVRILR